VRIIVAPPLDETHGHEVHAYEVHAREMYAHGVHAYEIHAYEVHAYEMHGHEVSLILPIPRVALIALSGYYPGRHPTRGLNA
jgi:hypothetical protein